MEQGSWEAGPQCHCFTQLCLTEKHLSLFYKACDVDDLGASRCVVAFIYVWLFLFVVATLAILYSFFCYLLKTKIRCNWFGDLEVF